MTATSDACTMQPYLFFEGRCQEAIEFYRQALGAEVNMMMRYKESPDPTMCAPGLEEKIMHASVSVGQATLLMSDGRCEGTAKFDGFALSLTVPGEAEAEQRFAALVEGGKVIMPLTKTFFSPRFGMVSDRFGVAWMILVLPAST